MDAVKLILSEHQDQRELIQHIEAASPDQRVTLWSELKSRLTVHEHIEDEFLYGPLSADPKAKGTPLADFKQHQDKDVAELKKKMKQLEGEDPAGERWMMTFSDIKRAVMDHAAEEESSILPRIPGIWDAARLEQAGKGMQDERQRKLAEVSAG